MDGYVFVGRRRHPAKIIVYQILTLGIYGRVLLFKWLRDFDGHEALFLDRRPYIFLLILPFVGPFLVKRRVAILLQDAVHHDPTTPGFTRTGLLWRAIVPLFPWFHLTINRVLGHHWMMHTKEEELVLKQGQLAALRRSKSADAVREAQALEKETVIRAKELEDLKQAAIALREAESVRRSAERSMGRPGPMALVRKLSSAASARLPRRQTGSAALADEEPDAAPPEVVKGKGKAAPLEKRDSETEPEATTDEETTDEAPKKGWKSFLPYVGKPKDGMSRADRKAEKQRLKEEKQAAKTAEKEKRAAEKEAAKAAKKEAKEAAKAAKQKEKKADKAKPEKKSKGDGKKEKPSSKPAASKAAKGKARGR